MNYEKPTIVDLGDLLEMTQALGISGTEDGSAKSSPVHHNLPSLPAFP
jgi:hypothetical protein